MGLVSCSSITTIQRVREHPHRHWFNKTVQLQGTVVDRAPLINALLYQLQDETGTIWILTTEPGLEAGAYIWMQGDVQFESIPIAGRELGDVYIQEQQREVVDIDDAEK
ncbi:MAG: hypothetical protein Kow00121_22620 [Elainellaceae cyanobacterium]